MDSNRVTAGNPTPVGTCIHTIKGLPYTNPYGVLGTRAPFSPAQEFNIRARYDFNINDYKPFVWAGANHIGAMANQPANYPPPDNPPTTTLSFFTMPGYTTYDAGAGVAKDNWTVQVVANNLSNSNASQFTSTGQFIESQVPLRPRTVMFQMNMKFGGETPAAPTPPPAAPPPPPAPSATATATAAAAAPTASPCRSGGSAARRDLRDELGEAAPGIGLDSGGCRREDRALPLLARRYSRLHGLDGYGEYNQKLSERRANAVKDYLESHGVPRVS